MTRRRLAALAGIAAVLAPAAAQGHLTRFVVERRDAAPAAPDWIILRGHYEGELDPADAHNRDITDIAHAARLTDGRVGYSATFAIAVPRDLHTASGVLLYDVPNRGNGDVAPDPQRHIRVVSGWQGDIAPAPGLQTLRVPIARNADGSAITGPVLQRFTDIAPSARDVAITGSIGRPTPRPLSVSLDTRRARLFRQTADQARPVDIPARDWAFADCRTRPFPGTPDPTRLCVRGGFRPNQAYTLVYRGRDPQVLGIGFAAVRDLNAFLRYGAHDAAGTPNPIAGVVRWAIVTGTSQSGNFVRSLIALGFNQAEDGRIVFDGANPNIAARQVPLNIRFGIPGGAADLYEPGSEGALWWSRYDDRRRGRGVSSLLDRCTASGTCPRIVETFGASELWGLRMSPNLVGTDARADLPLPANVRRYYFPSVTHNGSARGGFPLAGETPPPGADICMLPGNPNRSADTRRALIADLVDWVSTGKAPPPSRYPTLVAGDLVAPEARALGWPAIPGAPTPTGKINRFLDYDFGSGFHYVDLSGVLASQPPSIRQVIPSLVARVNADGNETSGIPSVQLLVPIGTYTGWNVRKRGYGAGGGCAFAGGFIPFARTRAERLAGGDPRLSLEERYHDHAGFVARVRAAAEAQVREGWLLPEDAQHVTDQAQASDVLR